MHVDVRDILAESVGYSRVYKISGERPDLETVKLTSDIDGEIIISRIDTGLLVAGSVATEIELVCDRCLCTFHRPTRVRFKQRFAEGATEDDFPIVGGGIDLAPLIAQEILLRVPIKVLHDPDCPGIENAGPKYAKVDTSISLKQQARINKGTNSGRT